MTCGAIDCVMQAFLQAV